MTVSIPARFHNMTLYQVLNVDLTANPQQLKSAYRKSAIKVHPDHNPAPTAAAEFAYLSLVHQTLSDSDKRKAYDETGSIDEALSDEPASGNDDFDKQYAYYRTMFPPITLEDIELHKQRYVGSDEEVEDLRRAYEQTGGKLAELMTYALHATADDVQRIADIISSKIDTKKKYTAKQIKAVQRQMSDEAENEAAELAEHIQTLPKHQRLALQAVESNSNGRNKMSSEEQLTALIQANQRNSKTDREKMFNSMLDKYSAMEGKGSKKGKQQKHVEPDIDDAEFERIQREIDARRAGNKKAGTASSTSSNADRQPASGEKRKRRGR